MRIFVIVFVLVGCSCQKEPGLPAASTLSKSANIDLSAEALKNAQVEVVTAKVQTLDQTIEAPGRLAWNDDLTVSIGVVTTGKVIHVYSKVGDLVKAKQMLAKMHSHDVHDTKALLRGARAEKERATSAVEQAKRDEARMRRLFELKSISQAQVEQATMERRNAESALRKANANVDRETQHLTETLEIGAEDEDSAGFKPNEENELVPIKSTAAGIVVDRKITPGTVVTLGQEAFVVTDPNSLWCIANFPESALSRIRVGSTVEIDVRAFAGRKFTGRITRLGDTIDANTRTLLVRAEVASQGVLKPEMLATIRLRLPAVSSLVIPESALQIVDEKTTVFVESQPGKFLPRAIEAKVMNGQALVSSGLKEGERVATHGSYFLKGQLLREAGR